MTLSIKSIDSFEKENIVEEVTSLVFAGFKSKSQKRYSKKQKHMTLYTLFAITFIQNKAKTY